MWVGTKNSDTRSAIARRRTMRSTVVNDEENYSRAVTNKSSITGIGFVVLSSCFFGLAPTFSKFAQDDGSTATGTLIARFTIAATIAVLGRSFLMRREAWPAKRTVVELLLLGGVGYFLGALFYFTALENIDSSLAIVLFNCYPLFVVFFGWVLFRHAPTWRVLLTLVITLTGVGISAGEVGTGNGWSIALCVGSALLYTAYSLGSSRTLMRIDVITGTSLVLVGGAASFWLYWLIGGRWIDVSFPDSLTGWSHIVLMGTMSTIGGTMLFFAGMTRIGAAKASIATTAEPVMVIVAGVTILGESLNLVRTIGALLVLVGLLSLTMAERRSIPTPIPQ